MKRVVWRAIKPQGCWRWRPPSDVTIMRTHTHIQSHARVRLLKQMLPPYWTRGSEDGLSVYLHRWSLVDKFTRYLKLDLRHSVPAYFPSSLLVTPSCVSSFIPCRFGRESATKLRWSHIRTKRGQPVLTRTWRLYWIGIGHYALQTRICYLYLAYIIESILSTWHWWHWEGQRSRLASNCHRNLVNSIAPGSIKVFVLKLTQLFHTVGWRTN